MLSYTIMYKINKLKKLMDQDRVLFHTQDLSTLWGITNKNTLYTTIQRYKKKGLLYPVCKGIYATKPIDLIDPWSLGVKIAHAYAYISCESILAKHGLINANPIQITLITHYSKTVIVGENNYRIRKLAKRYLYNTEGINRNKEYAEATLWRAVADTLYFNSKFHFDGEIDWAAVKKIQQCLGYPEVKR